VILNVDVVEAWIDGIQTIAIITNTAALIYVILRFDQAIRGADKGIRANITKLDEFRTEIRLQSDRTERRIERLEDGLAKSNQQAQAPVLEALDLMRQHIEAIERRVDQTSSIERVWTHIHEIEVRMGIHQDDSSRPQPT